MGISLSSLRLQLAQQIAQAVRNLASQSEALKKSMLPILSQLGIADIKTKIKHDNDTLQIILEFDFTTETLAENMYKYVLKYLGIKPKKEESKEQS